MTAQNLFTAVGARYDRFRITRSVHVEIVIQSGVDPMCFSVPLFAIILQSSIAGLVSAKTAAIFAGAVRLFQPGEHPSALLVFALIWLACAAAALASSTLVFRVAEVRKRVFRRQRD